jgi:1-acyl-sn-glycerol-3-phosphate acyltransferase
MIKSMYKPYMMPVSTASPDVKVKEPHISKLVYIAVRLLSRIYLFLFFGIARVVLRNGKPLFIATKQSLEGKSRCILAFRHPNGGEPGLLMWFMLFKLRSLARKAGVKIRGIPYVSIVFGYEVARWGGGVARWVMPGLGCMPVHHDKLDSVGMDRIYNAITEGPYPLAIAPEGQVSYTTESVPRLEPGTVRIGFGAAERLQKSNKNIPVEIIPISFHFRYGSMGHWSLSALLRKIEKYTGFTQKEKLGFSKRVERARNFILLQNEKRYGINPDEKKNFSERVETVMEASLKKAETILGINSQAKDIVARVYHIRQTCWDRIVLPGVKTLKDKPLLERSILDLTAGEAWYASRHMELVDFAWYFRGPVPSDNDPLYKKLEYAQNLWDFASRTMGGAYSNRFFNVHPKRALIQVGKPINLTDRLEDYKKDKKTAIADAMKALEASFIACIKSSSDYQI